MVHSPRKRKFGYIDILALVILLLILAGYTYNLLGERVTSDEGEYLYQVWRMTLGEIPYQDFMTPQLPIFLYLGMIIMKVTNVSTYAMRLYSISLTMASGGLLYAIGRKQAGSLVGLLAMLIFLLHPDVYQETRLFRNEPLFLFFVTAGLVIATWPVKGPKRRNLAFAGMIFGLATMVKLFGLLPAAGIGLWLIWDWRHHKRPFRDFMINVTYLTLPFGAILALFIFAFSLLEPTFLNLVLGHHLSQGSQLAFQQVILKKLGLYGKYISLYPVVVGTAIISAVLGFEHFDFRRRWAFQLFTAAVFVVVSRELEERHFLFLVPSLSILTSWIITESLQGRYQTYGLLVGIFALLAIMVSELPRDIDRARFVDEPAYQILEVIQEQTDPDQSILVDDIGMAFYTRRPTTYLGAALSEGAANSGQITGELLIEEMVNDEVNLVVVDERNNDGDHLVSLRDYPRFHRFLENNYDLLGHAMSGQNLMAIWNRESDRPWQVEDAIDIQYRESALFGENMVLLGYSLGEEHLAAGDILRLRLFWQAHQSELRNWKVFVHLIGPDGTLVSQHDKYPYSGLYTTDSWWPGQIVDEDYELALPADTPSGQYRIAVGMYDEQSGERLKVLNSNGEQVTDESHILSQPISVQ